MTTLLLFACSIVVVSVLAWLYRQRLAQHLPTKKTMTDVLVVASIVLLAVLVLLPDIFIFVSTMKLLPTPFKIILTIAAAVVACIGCSKKTDAPQPRQIRWKASETGYTGTTVLPPDIPDKKEEP
jgi:hypothetical protein